MNFYLLFVIVAIADILVATPNRLVNLLKQDPPAIHLGK